jgi:hypothetical protein
MSQFAKQERLEEPAGRVREVYSRAQELVGEHPAYSALACFSIGVGVGAAVALLLTPEKREKKWYQQYLPDEGFADDLAKQVRDTVGRMLPDAIACYLKRR